MKEEGLLKLRMTKRSEESLSSRIFLAKSCKTSGGVDVTVLSLLCVM